MSNDIKDYVERYPTYIEALDQIAELKAENLSLQEQSIRDNQNWIAETTELQQQLKDNIKQVCEKIRENIVKYVYGGNLFDIKGFNEFLDQIEKGENDEKTTYK